MVDREAQKLDDKLKRDFTSEELDRKAVTDITEIKCKAGKLFLSAVFDCFNLMVLGLSWIPVNTAPDAPTARHTAPHKNGGEPHLTKKTKIYGIITLRTKVRQNNGGIPKW